MSALFVTFEGLDGSGKSSHLEAAGSWLEEQGVVPRRTREPGGTTLGASIRSLFLDDGWNGTDGMVEALMVFAARRQHLIEVIEPSLRAGQHVLCDRFTDSTLAYQGYGRGVPIASLLALDELATGGRRPDLTLLFDLSPETARQRSHGGGGRGLDDRLDREELAFYERVRRGYLDLAAAEPERFRKIDSSGPHEVTALAVREALAELAQR